MQDVGASEGENKINQINIKIVTQTNLPEGRKESKMLSEQKSFLMICALLLIAAVRDSSAIMCYSCNSAYDPHCADPFNSFSIGKIDCNNQPTPERLIEADLTATLCRKTTQKVYGELRVVRGCGYFTDELDDKQCEKLSRNNDVSSWFCACTSDLCNSSNQLFHQKKITFAVLIMLMVYFINQRFNRQFI